MEEVSVSFRDLSVLRSGSSGGQVSPWCDRSAPRHRRCRQSPAWRFRCAVSMVTDPPLLLGGVHGLLQRQAGARSGRTSTQPPRQQTQEVVLVVGVQSEAEGPLVRGQWGVLGRVDPC